MLSIPIRPHKTLCKRLWLCTGLLAAFIGTLVIGNFLIPHEKSIERHMLGHDFTAFYAAGHFADSEQFDKLYDIEAVKRFEQETGKRFGLSLGDSYGPYWNPPFYAWMFASLSRLSYGQALLSWTLINLLSFCLATVLLCRMLPRPAAIRHWGLIPALLILSMPVMQAFSHGQNTCTSLLLLAIAVTFWRQEKGWKAGLVGGLLFYKPQLGAIVALAMVIDLGVPALAGLVVTGSALVLVSLLTMPGALGAFIHQLPANVRFMQIEHPYVWERHATIKAFWRLLFQGRAAAEPKAIVSILSLASIGSIVLLYGGRVWQGIVAPRCATALYRDPPQSDLFQRDRLITATILAMPLLMPFYFDYDLMLLAIPAVLYAGDRIATNHANRWLDRAWIALFLWTLVNPGIAATTHVNLTVPLLASIATLSILRIRKPSRYVELIYSMPQRLAA